MEKCYTIDTVDQFADTTDSVSDTVDAVEDSAQTTAVVSHQLQGLSDATSITMDAAVTKNAAEDSAASATGVAASMTDADSMMDALENLKAEAADVKFQNLDVEAYLAANVSPDTSVTRQLLTSTRSIDAEIPTFALAVLFHFSNER